MSGRRAVAALILLAAVAATVAVLPPPWMQDRCLDAGGALQDGSCVGAAP